MVITRGAAEDALQGPRGEQRLEARRRRAGDGGGDVEREAPEEDRPAAETVRHGADEDLAGAEADEVGGEHALTMVLVRHVERRADLLQGRQHDVHGERVQRHQPGDHADELDEAHGSVGR